MSRQKKTCCEPSKSLSAKNKKKHWRGWRRSFRSQHETKTH